MSIHRAAAKCDANQPAIVQAIREEGWDCHIIRVPCDVICWHPVLDVLVWLEIKDGRKKDGSAKQDHRQETQRKFLRWTSCPIVTTPEEALAVLRTHYPAGVIPAELSAWCHRIRADFQREYARNKQAPGAAERCGEAA